MYYRVSSIAGAIVVATALMFFLFGMVDNVRAQTSVIYNGSFDAGWDGWTHSGAVLVGGVVVLGGGDTISQAVSVDGGIYQLSLNCNSGHWYYNSPVYVSVRAGTRFNGELWWDRVFANCAPAWAAYTVTLLIPAPGAELVFSFGNGSTELSLDDISLTYMDAAYSPNSQISNGGFDASDGWTFGDTQIWLEAWPGQAGNEPGAVFLGDGSPAITQTFGADSGGYTLTFKCQSTTSFAAQVAARVNGTLYDASNCPAGAFADYAISVNTYTTSTNELVMFFAGGIGTSQGVLVDNVMVGDEYTPPVTDVVDYAGWMCPLTVTIIHTDTGSTITTTVNYTRPANLLSNWSFERQAGSYPERWATEVNGAIQDVPGLWWSNSVLYANSGVRSVSNVADFQIIQDMPLYAAGNYVAGFYARCVDGSCATPQLRWNGMVVVAGLGMSNTYQVFTGTHVTGGGAAWLAIDFVAGSDVYIDDVFVYPANDDGTLNCAPQFFAAVDDAVDAGTAPPGCVLDSVTMRCIPTPPGGAGTVCYHCAAPAAASSVQIWIAWLACVIRNLFSCSLRVWLFEISNGLRGLMATAIMAVGWLNVTIPAAVAWRAQQFAGAVSLAVNAHNQIAVYLSAVPAQLTIIINNTIGQVGGGLDWLQIILDIIQFLFGVLFSLLRELYTGLAAYLQLLIDGIGTIRIAFTAPPFTIEEFIDPAAPDGTSIVPGATTSYAVSWFFIALATVDAMISDVHAWPLIYTALGVIGIGLVFWFMSLWKRDIFPM